MKTYTSPERKLKKVMVEKRRRTRIDRALVQMKTMVLEALHVQPDKYAKMEKADILDLTVRFLRRVRQERHAAVTGPDPRSIYPAAAAMYSGYPANAASAAASAAVSSASAAGNPYPFKIAPLRPIPTSLSGHPYAHIGNLPRGPYRPSASPRFNPLKTVVAAAEGAMNAMTSQLPTQMTSLPGTSRDQPSTSASSSKTIPRRLPTATVTSSEVAEASSTSRGPDSPHRDVSKMMAAHPQPSARTASPCSTVTSSSEHKADSNNNDKLQSAMPGPSTSRQTPPASGSEARRHQIEAPIPLRMFKFEQMQEFPLFGPGVWRPWFA